MCVYINVYLASIHLLESSQHFALVIIDQHTTCFQNKKEEKKKKGQTTTTTECNRCVVVTALSLCSESKRAREHF